MPPESTELLVFQFLTEETLSKHLPVTASSGNSCTLSSFYRQVSGAGEDVICPRHGGKWVMSREQTSSILSQAQFSNPCRLFAVPHKTGSEGGRAV